ncbi:MULTISPECIES: ABC transporter permease [Paenibacillus]|uniref:Protein lplB n=2 Tax=Paenibacillus TaxID=44249 RepID=A0A1R1EZ81_9BACL|nr:MULTISPECIES: ABC transporter permease subunit [Paenibacillus]OMF57117.1 protein lplB [Paenibacillus rhizosphaerae]OXL84203.1 protein lplB [Paenibacillus sp. SSG-1]UYO02245.1 ABC transporter permease subunit [Paenibacillus sp. PSB04]GIO54758.1 sugar ABC transporter permease [Paenibacillus cineris]GIO59531.1 sugar ABC transporter permease [Paenibacillus cineris]
MTFKKWRHELPLHFMLLPALVLLAVFSYWPMVGIVIAFQKFYPNKGFFGSDWVGLDNFLYVYHLPGISQIVFNTIFIAVMKIIAGLVVPITVALLLNEMARERIKRMIQTLIYLPHFLSWVILGGVLIDVLSLKGILNQFLGWFGMDPVYFLGDNHWFPYVLVATDTWKDFGFGTIVYLAALTGIDQSLYEAAEIDGASRWRQTLNITIPGILPVVVLMTTLSLGNVLNAGFDQVFNLYSPQVYESGDIIDTFVYRIGLIDAQYSVATAVGLFKSVVSLVLISSSYLLAYRFAGYRIF